MHAHIYLSVRYPHMIVRTFLSGGDHFMSFVKIVATNETSHGQKRICLLIRTSWSLWYNKVNVVEKIDPLSILKRENVVRALSSKERGRRVH